MPPSARGGSPQIKGALTYAVAWKEASAAFRTLQRSSPSAEQVLAAASTRYYELATDLLGPPHKTNSQTAKLIEKAKVQFLEQGKSVTIIQPTKAGDDFNDILKKEGITAVKAYVKGYEGPNNSATTAKDTSLDSPHGLCKIEAHLTEQLQLYKEYGGTSIAKEAQQELTAYLNLLQQDQSLMQDLKAQNPVLFKETEQIMNASKGQAKER